MRQILVELLGFTLVVWVMCAGFMLAILVMATQLGSFTSTAYGLTKENIII